MGITQKLQKLESYERTIFAINFTLQQQVPDAQKILAIQLTLVAEDLAFKTPEVKRPALKTRDNDQFKNTGPSISNDLPQTDSKAKDENAQK
jgi:hypothetical protein